MKSLLIKSDIMAVKCVGDYLFTGVGNELQILKESRLKSKVIIFESQKIHGIYLDKDLNIVLIFGGKEVKIFNFDLKKLELNEVYYFKCNDWILSGSILNKTKFILVTAHNIVILFDFANKIKEHIECEEKCILYSAFIENKEKERIIILAGTVFNEILIWLPWNNCSIMRTSPVIHRLIGHKGAIFSILYDPFEKLICSTSDDRTVRLWSINDNTIYDSLQQAKKNISLKCSLYGHTARVWNSLIIKKKIISVGEDSQIIIWDTSGNMIRKFKAHQNDCVWCLDYQESQDLILSGGGDCGLNGHYLDPTKWFEITTLPLLINDQEVIKKVTLMYNRNIAAVTESGTLLYFNYSKMLWQVINKHEAAKNILLEISLDKTKLILAGNDGRILIYKQNADSLILFNIIVSSNTVAILSTHWLTNDSILYCTLKGDLVITEINGKQQGQGILPYSKERWVTCAILINSQHIVIGDRMGSIHVYKQDVLSNNASELKLIQTLNKVHGRLGVSCLVMNMHQQLISTGRNGIVNKYSISSSTHQLHLLSIVKIPFKWCAKIIPKCENEKIPETTICGFFESKFVMWIPNIQQTILEIDCGGGHRSWDFLCTEDNKFLFIYVKNKSVNCISYNISFLLTRIYLQNFHSMEINSMIFIKEFNIFISGGEDTTLRISTIDKKVLGCSEIYFDIKSVAILRAHLSSIRSLDICLKNNKSVLLFSGGGRAQLIVYELSLWNNIVECTPKIQHIIKHNCNENNYTSDTQTRIMDIKVHKISHMYYFIIVGCSDGVLRLYSLKIINEEYGIKLEFYSDYHRKCILKVGILESKHYFIVISIATDGKIAFWNLTTMLKNENLNCFNDNLNKQLSNIILNNSENHYYYLARPCEVMLIHQSGVNSFCSKQLQNDIHLIVTGGDDTAISIIIVKVDYNISGILSVTKLAMLKNTMLHRAQVTGLLLFDKYLISASTDQRITVQRYDCSTNWDNIKCDYVEQYCSTISDIQGICLTEINKEKNVVNCCVYGKGIEIVEIKIPEDMNIYQ